MKPVFLGLCLVAASAVARAQPQLPDPSALFVGTPVVSRTATLSQLASRGQTVELMLRQPFNGAKHAMVKAWGRDSVLLISDGAPVIKKRSEIEANYAGMALVPDAPAPALQIDDAVQELPITQLGEDGFLVARYTLRNTGTTALDVAVTSTSCGCTDATLDASRIEAGGNATLTATMRTGDERLVIVNLSSSDPQLPLPVVALQSRRGYEPFRMPSPVTLYGEKGQSIRGATFFELPATWKVARVEAQPAWLEAQLQNTASATKTTLPRYTLKVTAPASAPEGKLAGKVTLTLEGGEVQTLAIPVGGFVSNDISASPRIVALPSSPQGIARRVVVVRGPRPFAIRAIRSEMPGFEARFEPTIEAKAHAVELLVPVSGAIGQNFFERAIVELSDGRELPLDLVGSIGVGQLPKLASNVHLNAPAPSFRGSADAGQAVSLQSLRGSSVVLTFFPHCFTGGCESHLASLRDAYAALQASGTTVVAVSTDDAVTVAAFARELRLPFAVVSDPKREIALTYGAVQSATEAPSRLTFLIDKAGIVRWIDTDVHVQTHGADVLAKISELGLSK